MQTVKRERNVSLDLVRCVALVCVIGVHFFICNGFNGVTVSGLRMYFATIIRIGFDICVPMFLLLTGYLQNKKKIEKSYFVGIEKTLSMYLLASIFCGVYRVIFQEGYSLKHAIVGFFDYTTAGYSWYIEMYIGLYLLTPFLNVLYNNLESRKQKQWLIIVLILLTAVPCIVNIHRFFDLNWWLFPASSDEYYFLIPDWWDFLYPLTYYFIGCYLYEFPLKICKKVNLLLFVAAIIVSGSFNYYRSYGVNHITDIWQGWGSPFNLVQAVLMFVFLSGLDLSNVGSPIKTILAKISDYSLGAYLVSYVYDQIVYEVLADIIPSTQQRHGYLFISIFVILVLSIITSAVLNKIYMSVKVIILNIYNSRHNGSVV